MIKLIFELFLFLIFVDKSNSFSEIIEADGEDIIRCSNDSLPLGCLIMCMDALDCYQTDIYCYPDVPCRIECILMSSDDIFVCYEMNAHGNNASTMDVYVNSLAY